MYQTLVQNPESSISNELDTHRLRTNGHVTDQRRAKRHIPDNQKDELYWERRKRNNIAAKRSRENKRMRDQMKRDKFAVLEEENALLRKEICALKTRYGVPKNTSTLMDEEHENCFTIKRTSNKHKSTAVDETNDKEETVRNNSPEHCSANFENSGNGKAELAPGKGISVYTPFGSSVLTSSHKHSLQLYPSAHPGCIDAITKALSPGTQIPAPYQTRPAKPNSPNSTASLDNDLSYQEPFDLSINGSKIFDASGRSISQSSELNNFDNSPDPLSDHQLRNENDEIRKKLKQLSEQVSRMQKLFYTKQEN